MGRWRGATPAKFKKRKKSGKLPQKNKVQREKDKDTGQKPDRTSLINKGKNQKKEKREEKEKRSKGTSRHLYPLSDYTIQGFYQIRPPPQENC